MAGLFLYTSAFVLILLESSNVAGNESASSEEETNSDQQVFNQKNSLASCEVFDPFKVLPAESDHFQIGGAFPLHSRDCSTLIPSSVQDVVAIQWALAHWNEPAPRGERETEESKNKPGRPKLGLFAGDSCFRPKEAISQTLRFVDSVGYHEPSECVPSKMSGEGQQRNSAEVTPKLIGLTMPKDRESAESVAQVLRPSSLPIGAFSAASAQALADAGVRRFITTAPLFTDYARALIELIKQLGSDLVSIVDYGEDYAYTPLLQELLRLEGISVAEVVAFDHPMLPATLSASDSAIIVSLVPHRLLRMAKMGELEAIRSLAKLWVGMDLEMDGGLVGEEEELGMLNFLPSPDNNSANVKLQFVTIRRRQRVLTEFSSYFLRVLLSNHAHYSLLRAYVQQVYGCENVAKGKNCSSELLTPERLAKLHRPSNTAEAAVLLTYAFARTAEKIQTNGDLAEKCSSQQSSSSDCHDAIRATLLSLSPSDRVQNSGVRLPPGFTERLGQMRFVETREGIIQLVGIQIEAVLAENEGRSEGNIYRLLEYRTGPSEQAGASGKIEKFALPQKLRQLRSRCRPFRPFCGDRCDLATRRPDGQTFMCVPQHYSVFIAAMFDLRGPYCGVERQGALPSRDGVALPLAFVHAMSSFRQRHATQSSLFNSGGAMDIGALLVDTCSSGRNLMEFLVDSERNCYSFTQAERNWTIASGATIGYVLSGDGIPAQNGILQGMFGNPSASAVVGIEHPSNVEANVKSPVFAQGPTHRITVVALAQFLRRMHWQFVNVVLDRSDSASVSLFNQFDRIATQASICTADLMIIGEQSDQLLDDEEETLLMVKKRSEKRSSASKTAEDEQRRRFTGENPPPSANVTLVFAGAKQTADFMGDRLREELLGTSSGVIPPVHIMLGDAHNFYLHDPTNLAQYAGTLSFQPKDVTSAEFVDWIQTVTPLTLPEAWFWRHVEATWHCSLFRDSLTRFNGRMCTGEERMDLKAMGRLTKAGYLAKGVDQLLMAIDKAHKRLCPSEEKLCDEFIQKGRKLVRELLTKTSKEISRDAFEIFELVPMDHHGNFDYALLANMSLSRNPSAAKNPSDNGQTIHFENDYRPFAFGVEVPLASVVSRCKAPLCKCTTRNDDFLGDNHDTSELFGRSSYIRREPARMGLEMDAESAFLMGDAAADDPEVRELGTDAVLDAEVDWLIRLILMSLSSLLSAIALITLLIILIKIWRRTIRGSQSLGILLLLGIIAMHSSAFLFTAENAKDPLICHLRIALPALAHVLCFGVIIVKAIQLRNAESLASAGQQISYWNYWLLLFFIMAVQVVICFRWLLLDMLWPSSPSNFSSMTLLRCSHSSSIFLFAQVYTFFLLLLALLLSAQNRNIKRNYKEAKWLFITTLVCILILSAWAACHAIVNSRQMDYLTVLELHLTGAILLAFVFGPKLYVLLFYEPVVIQYAGADGCAHGGKGMDLFEAAEWAPEAFHDERNTSNSPTLSCGSSSNGKGLINKNVVISRLNSANSSTSTCRAGGTQPEDEEKVVSAFQTVMRKKASIGSNGTKVKRTLSGSARIEAKDPCSPNHEKQKSDQ